MPKERTLRELYRLKMFAFDRLYETGSLYWSILELACTEALESHSLWEDAMDNGFANLDDTVKEYPPWHNESK